MCLVSVLVPTFNRAHCLTRALDSVRGQTFADWELIIVDDGSTDDTPAVLKRWCERHQAPQRVLILQSENRGVSRARNWAAEHACGEYLAFLDSDDEWLPDKLERQLPLAQQFKWVHGEEIWIRNGVRVNAMSKHKKSGGRIFSRCVELCCVSPSASLVRRDVFAQMQGFRVDFPVCEDYELWLRMAERFEAGYVETPVVRKFGGHTDQLSRRFFAMDYFRVKALVPFLHNPGIQGDEREHLIDTVLAKTEILLKGYRKHGNMANYVEVELWRGWALRARSADQIAHSAAERLPRSKESLSL